MAAQWVDGIKWAGGSFSLVPRDQRSRIPARCLCVLGRLEVDLGPDREPGTDGGARVRRMEYPQGRFHPVGEELERGMHRSALTCVRVSRRIVPDN
ncbi:MAG TPA: hypothetical protein VFP92_02810 [Rhodanobacteraceae bacterium]|nr:hypothetical protein [Rhodanobacteraceae bacterium]